MSWDVLVQNFEGHPPPVDELKEGLPLGKAETVRKKIDKHLPGVDWSDGQNGFYEADAFSIEFSISDEQPVTCLTLAVRGGGAAFAALKSFAVPNKWSLFDCSESDFLDLDSEAASGFEAFQEFRERAIGPKNRGTRPTVRQANRKKEAPKKKAANPKAKRRRS